MNVCVLICMPCNTCIQTLAYFYLSKKKNSLILAQAKEKVKKMKMQFYMYHCVFL